MMNIKTLVISVSAALGLLLLSMPVEAGVINNSHWLVKSGDTVYSIAREMHPGDVKKQVRFRRELVKANPDVFAGNSSLMHVGSKLVLPKFSVTKHQKKPQIKTPRIAQAKPTVVTADPNDVIGKVVINIGDLKATNRSATRRLARHSEIISGDTLKTSKNARAQIRLKDGALISLQPDTEFKIAEYNFNGKEDGTERGIFELVKGGFRTITGLIGHKNKQNYKVRTTVATIGIRGTHYGLMLCEASSCAGNNLADGLYGGVVDGSVAADNTTGQHIFTNDQYFHIASAQDVPVETLTPPPVFDGALVSGQGTQTNTDGEQLTASTGGLPLAPADNNIPDSPIPVPPNPNPGNASTLKAPTGAGVLLAFNKKDSTGQMGGVSASVTVSGSNEILLRLPPSQAAEIPFNIYEVASEPATQGFTTHNVSVSSTATDNDVGINPDLNVIWGRWSGNISATEDNIDLQSQNNLHFVYTENLTPMAYLGGLTSTSHFYSSTVPGSGGTLPTDTLGGTGTQASNFSVTMDFLNQQISQYTVTANTPNLAVNAGASNVPFSQLGNFAISDIGTSCTGGANTCTGEASVAFVGAQAEAIISSYTLATPDGSVAVSGSGLALSATGLPQ